MVIAQYHVTRVEAHHCLFRQRRNDPVIFVKTEETRCVFLINQKREKATNVSNHDRDDGNKQHRDGCAKRSAKPRKCINTLFFFRYSDASLPPTTNPEYYSDRQAFDRGSRRVASRCVALRRFHDVPAPRCSCYSRDPLTHTSFGDDLRGTRLGGH